jgi:hypothetical protein
MSKSGELFMRMREQALGSEQIDYQYLFEKSMESIKSPQVVAIGKDLDEVTYFISGDTPEEVYQLAKENKVINNLIIVTPDKHLFKS